MKTPKFLYHGSLTPNIKEFTPRKRYAPRELGEGVPEAIYAGDEPAYAAAHSFPWSAKEGFDVIYEDGGLVLIVPKRFVERLNHEVYIYKLPGDTFELLKDVNPKGHNFWSHEAVVPTNFNKYASVTDAVKNNGGILRYI